MAMNINFRSIECPPYAEGPDLEGHAEWLAKLNYNDSIPEGCIDWHRVPPPRFEDHHCVDVFGAEFVWMNETFPKEKYTWYLWFESIFLVPDEMLTFLKLRWK